VIENTTIANGMAWSPDHETLYFIDTPTFEVAAYQYDSATGQISDRRVVITIPKTDGYPDGMTIDCDGMLWIAHWDGWQVTRWNPQTGEKLHHIKLPVSRITSCTFGGENLDDLFITSARKGLSEAELDMQPLAGSLFVIRNCGYQGLPSFQFNNQ
jgi:sugar lactone lactonase YvrE